MRLAQSGAAPILLTTDAVGGVWRYSIDLAAGMVARGVAPVLAVLGPAPTTPMRRDAARRGIRLIETNLPLDWTAAAAQELETTVAGLQRLAAELGAGSLHCHAAALLGPARWPITTVAVAHSCTATWWRAVQRGPMPADFAWREAATRAGLRAADVVVAPTQAHADAVRAVYGEVAVSVIHNASGLGFPPRRETERAVFTAGRLWDAGKGAAALDDAAARLSAPVYAAGPTRGPGGGEIALPHLRLLGALPGDAMAAWYRRCSVFASFARYEPFGLSVLEAARAGLRLVLSDIPSFRELWDGAARFVPLGADPLPALEAALDDPDGCDAARHARQYDIDTMITRTLALHARVRALA